MKIKRFDSQEGNVWKYVFDANDVCYEAVLYKYEEFHKRTVICCSVQCGCPVGCLFCGTGKHFIRDLSIYEIVSQITHILHDQELDNIKHCERFQIMFMSMGEPLLNWENVSGAIKILHNYYPNADLLISTIGVETPIRIYMEIFELSKVINKIGLQFSIHKSTNAERDILIPYVDKITLEQIAFIGKVWSLITGRKPYLNYCIDGTNNTVEDFCRLTDLFAPSIFCMTFSVICNKQSNDPLAPCFRDIEAIKEFEQMFTTVGYDTRTFDPAGQDDIGGGCGMLWYVQDWFKNKELGGSP